MIVLFLFAGICVMFVADGFIRSSGIPVVMNISIMAGAAVCYVGWALCKIIDIYNETGSLMGGSVVFADLIGSIIGFSVLFMVSIVLTPWIGVPVGILFYTAILGAMGSHYSRRHELPPGMHKE